LWACFEKNFPDDAARAMRTVGAKCSTQSEVEECRRLLGADRAQLLRKCAKAIEFANRRAAHSNPSVEVRTKVRDLDQAIDAIRLTTEKLILLVCDEPRDLLAEMLSRKILPGWDEIFLEPWATKETLELHLGTMEPPPR
jgi:hypothetical protein